MSTDIKVPISPGELIDKITILQIKSERMSDAAKLANVRTELALLENTWGESGHDTQLIAAEWAALKTINEKLWVIEDDIRDLERARTFDARFIELARAVYKRLRYFEMKHHPASRELAAQLLREYGLDP